MFCTICENVGVPAPPCSGNFATMLLYWSIVKNQEERTAPLSLFHSVKLAILFVPPIVRMTGADEHSALFSQAMPYVLSS